MLDSYDIPTITIAQCENGYIVTVRKAVNVNQYIKVIEAVQSVVQKAHSDDVLEQLRDQGIDKHVVPDKAIKFFVANSWEEVIRIINQNSI